MRYFYLLQSIVILFIFVSPSWPQKGRRQVSVISFENQSKDQKKYEFLREQLPSLIEARLQKEKQIRLQTRRNLKFIADGYADLLWNIERASGMMAAEILDQRLAFLSVNSTPNDARTYLNGNFIGRQVIAL